jgi:hypothetical protein
MSNFSGKHWNIEAGGKSCFINSKGELKRKLTTDGEGLVIIEKEDDKWKSKLLKIK